MGSAAFLSVGGYHHHIGLNTWNGVGAPPPPPDSAGLRYFTVQFVSKDEQESLINRLTENQIDYKISSNGLFVRDTSQNGIVCVQ